VIEEPVDGRDPSALRLRHPALDGRPLLQGRCIILTGAAGGIGRSMAEAFVCAGATLAATDLAGGPLDELLAELRPVCSGLGVDAPFGRPFDASDLDAFQSFVEEVGAQARQIDGLVNCAGAWRAAPYGELGLASFQAAVEQNLGSATPPPEPGRSSSTTTPTAPPESPPRSWPRPPRSWSCERARSGSPLATRRSRSRSSWSGQCCPRRGS
jgi:hypothetical protein